MHQWKKIVAASNVEAWLERLRFVDPMRLAVVGLPGARFQNVEVYCEEQSDAEALAGQFGGKVREVRPESWQPASALSPGRPLRVAGGRLLVTAQPDELKPLGNAHPRSVVLCIPAAMAFGTGEHATTSMCLRLLVETTRRLKRKQDPNAGEAWNALDLGTGSGILALAARQLGARITLGLDNDRHAIRTAKVNAALNGVERGVVFQRVDLLRRWEPDPTQPWQIITANLFSNLLVALMPLMFRALAPGGFLITSGILAAQAVEVENAALSANLALLTRRRRGKWVALLLQKRCDWSALT